MATPANSHDGSASSAMSSDSASTKAPVREGIHYRSLNPELRYHYWHLSSQYASLFVAVAGFVTVLYSVNNSVRSLRATVVNGVQSQIVMLDKIFVDKPDLSPYFYGGRQPDPNASNYSELCAVAEMYADIMDAVSNQLGKFGDVYEDPEAWERWLDDSLTRSPILVQYLRDHQSWYGPHLKARVERVAHLQAPRR